MMFVLYDLTSGVILSQGTHNGEHYLDAMRAASPEVGFLDVPDGKYLRTHRVDFTDPESPALVPLAPVAATVTPLSVALGDPVTINTPELVEVYVDEEYVGSVPPGLESLTIQPTGTFVVKLSPPVLGLVLPVEFTVEVT